MNRRNWTMLKSLGGRFIVSLPYGSRRRRLYGKHWTVVR